MDWYLPIILLSLALSFFFAGTETAFVSVNKVRVELWRRQKQRVAEVIHQFLILPERFLYTTLVGNNISNVAFATFATIYFNQYFEPGTSWLLITISTILFGEIIPKALFRSLADWIIRFVAYPLDFFHRLFYPFIWLTGIVAQGILKIFGHAPEELHQFYSSRDIEILLQESQAAIKQKKRTEGEYLEKFFELRDLRVRDAMVPRAEIIGVPHNIALSELAKVFSQYGYTRLPVYKDNLDNIIGIVHVKDLFKKPRSIKSILHPPLFIPETKRALELLQEFRQKNTPMAIVVDEYGGTAGLVTIEDLLEELFGEIEDEFDSQQVFIRKISDNVYHVSARVEIDDLNQQLGLNIPKGEYDTLAGFILSRLGHIPRRDEVIEFNNIRFVVTKTTRRKIEWIRIELPESVSHSLDNGEPSKTNE